MNIVGTVSNIYRYPVKSFRGETIAAAEIGYAGLAGDRTHVFLDRSRKDAHLSAKQRPQLLGYSASYCGDDRKTAQLAITSPEGTAFGWDERLLGEIERATGLELSMRSYGYDLEGLAAVDAEPILLATEQSLRKLEQRFGRELGMSRFRPNLVIDVSESAELSDENGWIGRTVRVGDVELYVTEACERCSMVSVNSANLEIDRSVLKFIVNECEGTYGVYAKVSSPGTVRKGDRVMI